MFMNAASRHLLQLSNNINGGAIMYLEGGSTA